MGDPLFISKKGFLIFFIPGHDDTEDTRGFLFERYRGFWTDLIPFKIYLTAGFSIVEMTKGS